MRNGYTAFPLPVNTPNGVGGAIGKSAETGEVLVRHPKGVEIDRTKTTFFHGRGVNGVLAWYRIEDVTEVTR